MLQELEKLDVEFEQTEEKIYSIQELLDAIENFGELIDEAEPLDRKKIVHHLVKEIVIKNAQDFKIELFFYEDLPKIKPDSSGRIFIDKEDTPQGVKWKIVEK